MFFIEINSHSINSDDDLKRYFNKYNLFYYLINEKANKYNKKIIDCKNFSFLIEQKTFNQNIILNDFSQIKNEINLLLYKKYENEIIRSTYNYYQKNIEGIMGNLLNNISFQRNEAFYLLYEEIKNNIDNFKNLINEFYTMTGI